MAHPAPLLHDYEVNDFGGRDEQRQTAGSDADEGGSPPAAAGIREDSEDAEGKSEERRRRARD